MESFSALSPMPLSGGARRRSARRSASRPRGMSMPRMAMGGRRHSHVRKVSAKTIRRTLRSLRMKPKSRMVLKGGAEEGMVGAPAAPAAPPAPPAGASMTAGRRRRHGGRRHRSLKVGNPLKALGF
jgi:hypothetical protein